MDTREGGSVLWTLRVGVMTKGARLIYVGKCLVGIGSSGLIHYRFVEVHFTNAGVAPGQGILYSDGCKSQQNLHPLGAT